VSDGNGERAAVRTALIVAGGRGTRLQPLTYTVKKPLVPFCGQPFLVGVIRNLRRASVDRVWLVVGQDTAPFETIRPTVEDLGVQLETVPEPEPLDTAGGVRAVADEFDGPVFVLNGDILADVDYADVGRRHVESGADATIVLTRVDDTSSYGATVRDGTRIVEFVEKPEPGTLPDVDTVNAGTYVLDPDVMLAHEQGRLSFEQDVFPSLLARGGHVEGYVSEGVWQDLGTPERYREGHRLALDGALRWPSLADVASRGDGLWVADGAEVADDARIEPPVLIQAGARIGPNAAIGPHAVIGTGSFVGESARVSHRAVLHDDVTIEDRVIAVGLVAGEGAHVETGAELGRDTVLGAAAHLAPRERLDDGERKPPRRDF
jgi:mannose-1-phosphate guanylyltransferase